MMSLWKRLNSPFLAGVVAALLFLVAGALDAVPAGIGLVCLIAFFQGTLPRPELAAFISGALAMMLIGSGFGLLLGDSISVALVMVPFLTALILVYAVGAFLVGLVLSQLWRIAFDRA